jgi:hypothetical protein
MKAAIHILFTAKERASARWRSHVCTCWGSKVIRFSPSPQAVAPEPVVPPIASALQVEAIEKPPILALGEPVAPERAKAGRPRASKKKPVPPAEGAPQLDLEG